MHSEEEQAHAVESARSPILNYRVARHEAGHALIAAYFRLPFRAVTIVPNLAREYDGRVLTRSWAPSYRGLSQRKRLVKGSWGIREKRHRRPITGFEWMRRMQRMFDRTRRRWEHKIACNLAGGIAEGMIFGSDNGGSERDEEAARHTARVCLKIPEEKIEPFIEDVRKSTSKLLETYFMSAALASISDRLEADKTLTYRQVRETYQNERVFWEIGIQFRRDWISKHPGTREVGLGRLYSDYCRWCRSQGVAPLGKSVFWKAADYGWKYAHQRERASLPAWIREELAESNVA